MCGIWTCISSDDKPVSLVSIRHRGPDDFGRRSFKTAAGTLEMANWRLSILGRSSSGHQPMSYAEGRYWIVFNGEIYNYLELREQLQQHGYRFRTDTDTEVILAAYAHFGESCLERFNGMFAFCLWDDRLRRLFVARDRFGEKPLYYLNSQDGLAFASEIKQFAGLPFFSAKLNVQEAYEFLTYGFIDHNHDTLFHDVRQLRGGECTSISMDSWEPGRELVKRQWYSLSVQGEFRGTLEEAANRYGELLADSTRLRLRADVSVGSCLSGGLDSSSIVSTVSRIREESTLGKVQETFSSCFDDPECDERVYMHEVEEKSRAKAHYVFPRQEDLFGALDRLVWHHDAPLGTTSVFAQWELFREARRSGVVVMLDGQGGDEQLASYMQFFNPHVRSLLRRRGLGAALREGRQLENSMGWGPAKFLLGLLRGWCPIGLQRVLRQSLGMSHLVPQWLRKCELRQLGVELTRPLELIRRMNGARDVSTLSALMITKSPLPMLLHWEDRNSMAHSVEARVPFLDHRLVEFALSLPSEFKIRNGATKVVLREAMTGIVPDKIRERRDKIGFATPEERWVKHDLREYFRDGLREACRRYSSLFDSQALDLELQEMLAGRRRFSNAFWRVVSFGAWGRVFGVAL